MQSLNERSAAYWRPSREQICKTSIEEIAPPGSEKAQGLWKAFLAGLSTVITWVNENKEESEVFLEGNELICTDTVVVGALIWTKTIL